MAPPQPPSAILAATAVRYAGCGRAAQRYVATKLKRDPVAAALLAWPDDLGEIADLGCGRGQFGIALLLAGKARRVTGCDLNVRTLDQARRAGQGLEYCAMRADFDRAATVPACDTALIVDVLYQLTPEAQLRLVAAAAGAARSLVVIRTVDPDRGWRSRFTLAAERVLRPLLPHSGRRIAPMPVSLLADLLRRHGFAVSVAPCWQGTPFANVLLSARRDLRAQGLEQRVHVPAM